MPSRTFSLTLPQTNMFGTWDVKFQMKVEKVSAQCGLDLLSGPLTDCGDEEVDTETTIKVYEYFLQQYFNWSQKGAGTFICTDVHKQYQVFKPRAEMQYITMCNFATWAGCTPVSRFYNPNSGNEIITWLGRGPMSIGYDNNYWDDDKIPKALKPKLYPVPRCYQQNGSIKDLANIIRKGKK